MDVIEVLPKSTVDGTINVPSSKSYAQRAIAIASLCNAVVSIYGVGKNDDVLAAQKCTEDLGAQFFKSGNTLKVQKGIDLKRSREIQINCVESGLCTRLMSAFSLLYKQPFTITGQGSINHRTMEMVVDGLQKFGKHVTHDDNKLPITAFGAIQNKTIEIDGSVTSQFLTGLLIVAPFLPFNTEIIVHNLTSQPYIKMTLDVLKEFGIQSINNSGYKHFKIKGNQTIIAPVQYTVEGDWSAAAFMVVAGAIGGKIQLQGLRPSSKQGDRAIVKAVERAGAKVNWINQCLIVEKGALVAFDFDATECPDLFPSLVVLAAYANGDSVIKGASRLIHKESNRAKALQKECSKIGVNITINNQDDKMIVHGKGKPEFKNSVVFSSYNDHRMAMAMSLFSIGAEHPIKIEGSRSINKSYPQFYKDYSLL